MNKTGRITDNMFATITPDPVLNEARLKYYVGATSRVIINMYNSSAHLVLNLVNGVREPGEYYLPVKKHNLKEGYYFISIMIGGKQTMITVAMK